MHSCWYLTVTFKLSFFFLCDYKVTKLTTIFDMPSIQASTVVKPLNKVPITTQVVLLLGYCINVSDEHHGDEYTRYIKSF